MQRGFVEFTQEAGDTQTGSILHANEDPKETHRNSRAS